MWNQTEKDIHDTTFEEYETNMIKGSSHWKLEDSEQYQLIEQGEKELAVSEWAEVVKHQATQKQYRDK